MMESSQFENVHSPFLFSNSYVETLLLKKCLFSFVFLSSGFCWRCFYYKPGIMKIIRSKRVKKILGFYRNYFDFRTPYQILIDGTFSRAVLNFHIQLDEQVAKFFEAEVKLCTTSCIISEAEALSNYLFFSFVKIW